MMGVAPYLGISFTMYDELQQLLPDDRASRNSPWYSLAKMGTGITAGLTAHTVVYPLDTLRRRMQVCYAKGEPPLPECCFGHRLASMDCPALGPGRVQLITPSALLCAKQLLPKQSLPCWGCC